MSKECFSKEVETRLREFFTDETDVMDMAKIIREVNYTLSLCSMRDCETVEAGIKSIDDNYYWLNRLAEILDPYLDID